MALEPTRLVFKDEPAPSATPKANGGPAPVVAPAGEPRPLVFPPDSARAVAPAPAPEPAEVTAVRFPAAAAPCASTPALAHLPTTVAAPSPRPVDFSRVPPPPPPAKAPGVPAFASPRHALHATVVAKARTIADALLNDTNVARLDRLVAELLPLRIEAVENFGALMLEQGRVHAVHTTQLTTRYNQLGAGEILRKALEASMPVTGLRQRLKAMVADDPATVVLRLRALRQSLADSLKELREAQPEALADAERLALLLLALRSTLEVCGTPQDNVLEFAVHQRLDTLRLAVTQANLVPAQLKSNEQTASLQLAECDRLLNVTFSASAMAQGRPA